MIKLEPIEGAAKIGRVYDGEPVGERPPFTASFVWEWDAKDPRAVWIKAFKGTVTRANLRELLALLIEHGVWTVMSHRTDRHVLPFTVVGADGVGRTDVARLADRFAQPGASNWADVV